MVIDGVIVEHFFCDLVNLRVILVHIAQPQEGKGASQNICSGSLNAHIKVDLSSEIPEGVLKQV